MSFPATGAIAGENFYFISNTGIAKLKDDKIVDPKKLEPIHIAVVELNWYRRARPIFNSVSAVRNLQLLCPVNHSGLSRWEEQA